MKINFEINYSQLFMIKFFSTQASLKQAQQNVRFRSRLPMNTVILFVPQQEAWVVERFGKYKQILEPVSKYLFY